MPRPQVPREIPVAVGPISDFAAFNEVTHVDLRLIRGDAARIVFRCCERVELDGCGSRGYSPQTLDGYEARATIRPAVGSNMSTTMTVTVDETAGSGRITLQLSPSVTRTLYEHGGAWDLELSDGTDDLRKTIVQGNIVFLRDVSL